MSRSNALSGPDDVRVTAGSTGNREVHLSIPPYLSNALTEGKCAISGKIRVAEVDTRVDGYVWTCRVPMAGSSHSGRSTRRSTTTDIIVILTKEESPCEAHRVSYGSTSPGDGSLRSP
jgi:hypothetical protein